MDMIRLTYKLTKVAQRAAILAGVPAHETRTVAIPITAERLAIATIDAEGVPSIAGSAPPLDDDWIRVDSYDADPAAVLDRRIAEIAERSATLASQKLAQRMEWEAQLAVSAAYVTGPGAHDRITTGRIGGPHGAWFGFCKLQPPGTIDPNLVSETARANERTVSEWLQVVTEREEHDERQAREAARHAWIREHGSERLRKCLDLGMIEACHAIYLGERREHDFPDWGFTSGDTEEGCEVRYPTLEALQALEEARKVDKDAMLVTVRPQSATARIEQLMREALDALEEARQTLEEALQVNRRAATRVKDRPESATASTEETPPPPTGPNFAHLP